MAKQFKLSVVAPDRTVFEDDVESFIAPGVDGYLGVMADHEPSIVALKTGVVEYIDASDQKHFVSISGGFPMNGRDPVQFTILGDVRIKPVKSGVYELHVKRADGLFVALTDSQANSGVGARTYRFSLDGLIEASQ